MESLEPVGLTFFRLDLTRHADSEGDRYFRTILGIDPDSIWIRICEGDVNVTNPIRGFFAYMIDQSYRSRPSLVAGEYEERRGINSAVTLDIAWKLIMGKAEEDVLQRMRQKDREKKAFWTIAGRNRRYGPAFMISKVNE